MYQLQVSQKYSAACARGITINYKYATQTWYKAWDIKLIITVKYTDIVSLFYSDISIWIYY